VGTGPGAAALVTGSLPGLLLFGGLPHRLLDMRSAGIFRKKVDAYGRIADVTWDDLFGVSATIGRRRPSWTTGWWGLYLSVYKQEKLYLRRKYTNCYPVSSV
jgi:hypothetical protein